MPDILPPQLVGVQQRPLYVKVRTAITVISGLWLILAVTGVGFFSGGTTSLALSLVLMYGTGVALIVVIAAVYRVLKNWAMKRTETAPEDAAAGVFVDTTRSATEELLAALRPTAATGRPQSAPGKTVHDKAAAAESGPRNASVNTGPDKSGWKSAQGGKTSSKTPPVKSVQAKGTTQEKGRSAGNNGSESSSAERTGTSAERPSGKKQPGVKEGSAEPVGPADVTCSAPPTLTRPSLVLAAGTALPQPRPHHLPDSRQRAS